MPIFNYKGQRYNVADEYVNDFISEYPDATAIEEHEGRVYRVKASDYHSFIDEFRAPSAPSAESIQEEMKAAPSVATAENAEKAPKKRITMADTLNATVPGMVSADYSKSAQEEREKNMLTQEEKDQRAAMRQRLQADGTIDRMEEMKEDAREAKRKTRREAIRYGLMAAEGITPQDTDLTSMATEHRQNKLLQEKLDVALDMARAGENQDGLRGVENFGLGLWDSATRLSTWDFGASDIANNLTLQQIVEKWENDPSSLTATEQKVVDGIGMATAVQELYSDQVGVGYNVGQSLPESASFMMGMALNPASGLGKSLARNAVRTYGRNSIAKNLARIGGDIAETAIMTATTGAGRVAADALERINGSSTYEIGENGVIMYGGQKDQETVGDAVLKAIGANFIENYSEALGEYFDPLLGMSRKVAAGGLRKMNLNKWADALSDVQPSQMTASIRSLREKTKFGGIFGEIMEEEIGMALNTLFVGDNKWSDFVDLETQLTTVLSCAIMSGTLNGVEQVSSVAARRKMEKNAKNAEQEASYRFSSDKFAPLREAIDQASPEGMVDVLRDVYMSQEYTVGQKRALAEYAAARLQLQYYNAADAKARRQVNKTQQELLDAQEAGLNAQLPQFFNIARAAQSAEDDLVDYDGDWNLVEIIRSSMNRPEEMERILGDLPPRETQLVMNYIYSRARMEGAYLGRSNRAEDYIDDFAYALEPAVVTDAEGNRTITTAIMGDYPVYVLDNNGDLAHIMRPDGSKTLVKASELTNITTSSADEVIDRYRDMYTSEYNAETENAFEHHPKTQAPQVGLQLQSPEGEVVITAVNDNMVEIVPAVYKDGQVQPKEGAEPRTITVNDAYAWQDDYYLSMDADQAYANAMAEAGNVSEETAENEGAPIEQIEQSVSEEVTNGQNGYVGRTMTQEEADAFIPQMVQMAEPSVELEFTPENWIAEFGEDGVVPTPIGAVKMGENQYFKLSQKKRTAYFGMVKPTLTNPDLILEEYDPKDGAERDTKLIFVKTFVKPDGSRTVNFESVTVKKGDLEVSISSHEIDNEQLFKKVQQDKLLHLNEKFSSSEMRLTEPQQEGSDLVPSPNSISSNVKGSGNVSDVQENSQENVAEGANIDAGINKTARERVPKDEKGNPIYEHTDADTAWDAIVEETEGDTEMAQRVADDMLEDKKAALAKLQKGKPKKGATVAEKIANEKAHAAAIAQAQNDIAQWEAIVGTEARRREAAMSEADRYAAEMEQKNISEGLKALGEPQSLEEYVLGQLAGGAYKLRWSDKENGTKGFGSHTGLSTEEMKARLSMIDNKNGLTPEEIAHSIVENMDASFGEVDVMDVTNMVIDAVATNASRRAMLNGMVESRAELLRQQEIVEQEAKDAWYMEQYHATEEELTAYNEYLAEFAEEIYGEDTDYEQRIATFAEIQLGEYDNQGTDADLRSSADQGEGLASDREGGRSVGETEQLDRREVLADAAGVAEAEDGRVGGSVSAESDDRAARIAGYRNLSEAIAAEGAGSLTDEELDDIIGREHEDDERLEREGLVYTEERLENGDVRITGTNSNGQIASVATERDGKVISVDTYEDGALFEHTDYDANGNATKVTRYKDGEVVSEQEYKDGKRKVTANVFEMAEEAQKKRKSKKKSNDKLAEKNHQQEENRSETRGVGNRPQLQDASSYESFVERVAEYLQRSYKGTELSEEVAQIIRDFNKGKTILARTEQEKSLLKMIRVMTNKDVEWLLSELKTKRDSLTNEEERKAYDDAVTLTSRYRGRGEHNAVVRALTGANLREKLPLTKIDELFDKYNSDADVAELYRRVRAIAEQIGLDFWFDDNMVDVQAGGFRGADNRVRFNAHMLYSPFVSEQTKASVMVHEILHAVADYAIETQEDIKLRLTPKVQLSKQVLNAANTILNIYEKVVKNNPLLVHEEYDYKTGGMKVVPDYGTTSAQEMLMEISNPEFRDKLMQIEYNGRSVWQRIWDAIKSMFTKTSDVTNSTAYDHMAKALDVLINEFSVDAYQKYSGLEESARFIGSADENLRFREKEEPKELIAVHNISEGNLKKVLEAGSLIMPSIAITKADMGHTGYGEISLLFDKETINPSDRRNKVYGGDSWTPRFPQLGVKLNEKVVSRINKKIYDLIEDRRLRETFSLSAELYPDNIKKVISDYGVEGYYREEWMKLAYLLDSGKRVKIPTRTKNYSIASEGIIRLAKEKGVTVRDIYNNSTEFYENNPDFVAQVKEVYDEAKLSSVSEEKRDEVRKLLQSKQLSLGLFDASMRSALEMEEDLANGGLKEFVDRQALRDLIEKNVKTDNADYNKWVDELFDGIVEKRGVRNKKDWYTPSGNQRSWEQLYDDATPANILKYMLAQNEQGGSGSFFDSNIMGASAETYGSIEEIREKGKQRLKMLPFEEYDEWSSSIADRMGDICYDFIDPLQRDRMGGVIDAKIDITNAVAKGKTAKGIYKEMKRDYPNFTMEHAKQVEEIVKEIQEFATGYFEAKPQRLVSINEVRTAVVPSNASKEIVDALKNNGIEVVTYKKGDEEARKRAVKRVSSSMDIKFREGMGAISDREVSYENDPIAKWDGKPRYYGKRAAAFAERERRRMENAAREAAEVLGIEAEIVTDASTLQGRKAKAKGWYDIINKKVVVVVPNHVSMGDAVRTVLHEGVAHHGLRELFGDGFDAMLDNVYNNVASELKARIDAIAERTGVSTQVATEEYLASLAETTNFEEAQRRGWWAKIKQYFVKMLDKLGIPGLNLKEEITDNELRFLLWRSYQNLVDPNRYLKPLGYLDDVAKQKELKVGNYAENTMATPMAEEMSEAEEWSAVTMQRIEELEAQMAQLDSEIAEMEADRDADDASRYDIWEQQLEPLRKQLEDVYAEIEGLYSLEAEAEEMSMASEDAIRYRLVDDQAEIDRLESEPTIKAYRAMQVINGELYPPMSAVVDGKLREPIALGQWEQSEERPDLADDNGRFKLDKGNKKSLKAAYNPYFHSSSTPLNDQFSEAQDRDNLVTVEVEVPVSEADGTSGYKAEKAKDAVGTHQWKAGIIQGQLTGKREVFLTRWDKPIRIVPESEVADVIVEMFDGKDIVMPSNVVTPQLRKELEARGITFVETDNQGKLVEGEHKGGHYSKVYGKKRGKHNKKAIVAEVEREATKLGVKVRIARSVDELTNDADTRKRAVNGELKGYFDTRTGEVVVYEPNTDNANDAKRTVLHEIVGHKGLRQLIGEEQYDKAMVQLMYMLPSEVRYAVLRGAERNGWNAAIAMDEYLAEQAERDVQPTWWGKVNAKIRALLRNMGFNVMLTDADVTYLLWRSRKKLQGDTAFDMATDAILKQAARKSAEADAWNEQAFKDMEMRDFERNALPSIRHRMGADTNDYEKTMRTLGFKQSEAWQDSMRSLLVFQQALAKASGKDISDFENAYMYENRMSSANLMEMEQYRHMVYNPLLKEIYELEQMGASRESIINYLFAKSGLERNEVFARRDAKKHAEGDVAKEQQLYDKYRQKDYAGLTALTRGDAQIAALVDDHSKKKTEYDRLEQNKKRGVAVSDADLKATKKEMDDARKAMITAIEAEAQRMVDEFERAHNTDNLWDKIRNCTHTTLNISHDAGVMSDEVYNELWTQFQYYIPLRGFAETTAEDVYLYLGGNDSPYNAPIKTAYGRTSLADDPIATIGNMAESAIVEANRNRLKQRFLYMVERHNTDLASISDVWLEYDEVNDEWHTVFAQIPDDATPSEAKRLQQEFEDRMKQLAEQNPGKYANASQQPNIPYRVVKKGDRQEHHVIVKRNGKDVVITINGNPRVAQAINGLTNPEQNQGMITRITSWINRNLSANFTMRNPAFMVSNFVRDGFYTNSMAWVKENPAYAWQYNKNWLRCTAKIMSLVSRYKRYEKGDTSALDMNNDMDRMFYEFMINGGETGYTVIKSVEDYKGLISGEMKKMEAGAMGTARRVADKIGDVVDTFGRWAEDTSRFAAYMTSRQLGRTITKSIWDAKEISVNFNKKGSGNRMMGKFEQGNRLNYVLSNMSQLGRNLYVFWNAGVQGFNNFKKAAKDSPAKFTAMAGTYFTLGVIVAAAFSGDDDEDDYYNLPEYVRRNNICFKIGKGKYATLPLPIEIRAIYGLGELAYSYLSGREGLTHGEAVTKTIQQMTQVMPIDMMADGGGVMALVPSAAKPVVEVIRNVDWTGRPIYKEETSWNKNDPTWTLAFKSTNPELVKMSRRVNEWTNKNTADGLERPYNRGWADNRYLNNPAVWEHIAEGYLGGMATMFNQSVKSTMALWNEDLREVRNVPIVSRFVKDAGKEGRSYAARNEYYEAKNIMDSWRNEMSKAKKEVLDGSLTDQQRVNSAKLRSSLEAQYAEAFAKWKELDKQRENLEKVLNTDISDQAKEEARKSLDAVMMQMATLVDAYR